MYGRPPAEHAAACTSFGSSGAAGSPANHAPAPSSAEVPAPVASAAEAATVDFVRAGDPTASAL